TADNPSSCETSAVRKLTFRVNYDETPAASATDTVESDKSPWTIAGTPKDGALTWSRAEIAPLNHGWRGIDFGAVSDTWLATPELHVGMAAPFVVTADHRFKFETGDD